MNEQQSDHKRHLASLLTECEDRSYESDVKQALRRARRELDEGEWSESQLTALTESAREVRAAIREERAALLRVALSELQALLTAPPEPEPESERPGLLARLLSLLFHRQAKPQDDLMRRHEADAEKNVFELEKRIAGLIDARAEKVEELRKLKAKREDARTSGSEAAILERQMRMLVPQIQDLDGQIAQHDKLLLSNAKYKSMLETGRMTFELKSFMPDTAEAELLLGRIERETQSMVDDQQIMDDLLRAHDETVHTEVASLNTEADASALREFDQAAEQARTAAPEAAEAPREDAQLE